MARARQLSLVDGDLADHAGSGVWLAVEAVRPGHGEGDGEGLAGGVEVLLLGDLGDVDAGRHGVLVEHNVVWEPGVVLEGDGLAGLDAEVVGLEHQHAAVGAEEHVLRHGAARQHGAGGHGHSGGAAGLAEGGAHHQPAAGAPGSNGGPGEGRDGHGCRGKGGHCSDLVLVPSEWRS